jgi:carboxylesterase family protein
VPTFGYEFNDDAAPFLYAPPGTVSPPVATHGSELPYLFGLPNAPFPAPLSAGQQALAASMRAAWASFAALGNPATAAVRWPAFGGGIHARCCRWSRPGRKSRRTSPPATTAPSGPLAKNPNRRALPIRREGAARPGLGLSSSRALSSSGAT